jgi:hypothetical protein
MGGLAHYWDFEDAVAGTSDPLADTANAYPIGGGYAAQPATPVSGTTLTQIGRDGGVSAETGMMGPCYETAMTQMDSASFTLEAWMRWDGTYRGWANPFGTWGQSVMIHMGGGKFWVGVGGTTWVDASPGDPSVGDWVHLAIVADAGAGTVTGYCTIDGNPLTQYAQTDPGVYAGDSTGSAFRIGHDYKTHAGLYDWVAIFDEPLEAATLEDHYLNGFAPPEPGTLSLLAVGALAVLRRRRRR